MAQIDVSIIIPAYNAENTLDKCIVSLLCQTLRNIEIIIVNDGSSDRTQDIIDSYVTRFPDKIIGIRQENSGPSVARNKGILTARGTYIGFADSDDWADSDMMRKLFQNAEQNGSDLVTCGRFDVIPNKIKSKYIKRVPISQGLYGSDIFHTPKLLSDTTQFIWDKLFRRSILIDNNILFSETFRYTEDVLFLCVYKFYCRKITVVPESLCYHDLNERNATSKYGVKILDVPHVLEAVFAFYTEHGYFEQMSEIFFELAAKRLLFRLERYPYVGNKPLQYEFYNELYKVFEKYFPNWKRKLRLYKAKGLNERIGNAYRSNRLLMKMYIYIPNPIQQSYLKLRSYFRKFNKKVSSSFKAKRKKVRNYFNRINTIKVSSYYYKHYYKTPIQDNLVLIESKSGKDLAGNMFRILEQVLSMDMQVSLTVHKDIRSKVDSMLSLYHLPTKNLHFVAPGSLPYYKALATAKYLFNDSAFPPRYTKREGQIYTNTWHGTPLKFMGRDVPDRAYSIGGVQRNFMLADYLVYPNDYMKDKMTESYMLTHMFKGKYICGGYPRNAVFFDEIRRDSLRKELGLDKQRIYVYMPTWRGKMTNKRNTQQWDESTKYFERIDQLLSDNETLYVKMHLYASTGFCLQDYKHIKPFPTEFETYDFLNIADCLITDYSSVFYDFANSGKKIVLFTYDADTFYDERGVYMQLNELPFPKVATPEALVAELNSPKNYDDTEFRRQCCTYDNKDAAKKLCSFLIKGEETVRVEDPASNGNENVLIYANVLKDTDRTRALYNALDDFDYSKRNYYICVLGSEMSKVSDRLVKLPRKSFLIPLTNLTFYTYKEAIAYYFNMKQNKSYTWADFTLDRLYKREWTRNFGVSRINTILLYDDKDMKRIAMMEQFPGKKALFLDRQTIYTALGRSQNKNNAMLKACSHFSNVVFVSDQARVPELQTAVDKGIKVQLFQTNHKSVAKHLETIVRGLSKS